jgi:serine protease Do
MQLAPNPQGGVTIDGVAADSEAGDKGLERGDVIMQAGPHAVQRPQDVATAIDEARRSGRKDVLLLVEHDGRRLFVPLAVQHANG